MNKTRWSLYYLVTYLTLTGLGLMWAPAAVLRVLGATHAYDDAMPRFAGILMVALGLLVSQVIRFRLAQLYPITVYIRLGIWAFVAWLYLHARDPFFVAVLAVVGVGILLTAAAYLAERGAPARIENAQ
jgi:uncharacterized protein YjeT (DUF2065 family)